MLENMNWNHVGVLSSGSVYPVKSGKQTMGFAFYYKVENGKKERKVVTGNSTDELREKAVRFLDQKEREYEGVLRKAEEEYREAVRPRTFGEASEEWFRAYSTKGKEEGNGKSFASIESRMYSMRAISKVIGDMPVEDIDDAVARDLIAKCSRKENGEYYSRSHVDKLQQTFCMVMTYARNAGYCAEVPGKVELSRNLKTVDEDARFLDENQIKLIHRAVENNIRYKTILHFLVSTGLRQEEAFALNVNDFYVMKDGNVEVRINKTVVEEEGHEYKIVNRTKTSGSKRKVFIPKEIYDMVMEYYNSELQNETDIQKILREENGTEGYIFLNKERKPINKRTFQRNFKDYMKRNCNGSIDFNVTLHMFRHTFASIQSDYMGLDKIALLMGDSLTTVNRIYQSLTNKTKAGVCENSSKFYNNIIKDTE